MIEKRIKELRLSNDMTQKDLADYLGLTPKMVSFYELGQRVPPSDIILKLADKFGVSTDYLLGNNHPTPGYYDDPEVAEMANRLKDDPDMKILFDASKKLSKDDLQFVIDMVHRMKKE